MTIVGRKLLTEFMKKHADVRTRLQAWLKDAEEAKWQSHHDIKHLYPGASIRGTKENVVIFDIGRKYRLEAKINYKLGVLVVSRIDIHSDYEKWS